MTFKIAEEIKEPLNKSSAGEPRIFWSIHSVLKMGNTQSIPSFSELLPESKSLAVSSCRFNQSLYCVQSLLRGWWRWFIWWLLHLPRLSLAYDCRWISMYRKESTLPSVRISLPGFVYMSSNRDSIPAPRPMMNMANGFSSLFLTFLPAQTAMTKIWLHTSNQRMQRMDLCCKLLFFTPGNMEQFQLIFLF